MLSEPQPKQSVKKLWRKVADVVAIANALSNMTVYIEGDERLTGKLEIRNGVAILRINSNTEVGSQGT
jgi:hypothetical protein